MTYIIENANVLNEQTVNTTSFLVKQDKIASVLPSVNKLSYMRMDANSFIMTPTYTMFDPQLPENKSFQELKQYFLEEFIKKGCTTFLTTANIEFEAEFSLKIKRKQAMLNTSPIDYIIAVKIPVRLLTPSFIRKCKKEKIPAIFVEIEKWSEIVSVPWGWIKEALFPYNCPLIPVFSLKSANEMHQAIDNWRKITTNEKIPSLKNEIPVSQPMTKQDLAKIGIYPLKSNLLQGGELSYNMYLMDSKSKQVEQMDLFHYHNHRLVITMHKGKVIRAGEKVVFRSGFGEKVTIKMPSFYTL
ncbi:hypothetical protein [Neobacillus sp. LXY-4]|uniref:hypothetical protein n=1 Tax=Neobacillus sp. LXY-4 TaxID=3379826 RepID=UPI003EDEA3F8